MGRVGFIALSFFALAPLTHAQVVAVERDQLLASDGQIGDQLTNALAADGNWAVAGARRANTAGLEDSGAAYIFERSGDAWNEVTRIEAPNPGQGDEFGFSADISGDTVVVGVPYDQTTAGPGAGSAHVFVRVGSSWSEEAQLVAPDGSIDAEFGFAVAVDGDTILVGARKDDEVASDAGAVYVFERTGTTWTEVEKLLPLGTLVDRLFGSSIDMDGDRAAVGAPSLTAAGQVYVFDKIAGQWTQEAALIGSRSCGTSVAVEGDVVVGGAPNAAVGISPNVGNVTIFTYDGPSWSTQTVSAGDQRVGSEYGSDVSIDQGRILVGAGKHDSAGPAVSGSVYLLEQHAGAWHQTMQAEAATPHAGQRFGTEVVLQGDHALIGAFLDDAGSESAGAAYWVRLRPSVVTMDESVRLLDFEPDYNDEMGTDVAAYGTRFAVGIPGNDGPGGSAPKSGAVQVFVSDGAGGWALEQQVTASNASFTDRLGTSVDFDQDMLVAGAPGRDLVFNNAGTAFVFVRNGSTWTEQAELLPSDSAPSDAFGSAVAVFEERVVVGSPFDDNLAGSNAGAAYVFARSGTTWTQEAKLRPAAAQGGDLCGTAVDINGSFAVLGAPRHGNTGAVFVFERFGTSWGEVATIIPPSTMGAGWSVAIGSNRILVGAPEEVMGGRSGSGAVHVYRRQGAGWQWEQRLTPLQVAYQWFGLDLAIDGDRIVVGNAGQLEGPEDAAVFQLLSGSWQRTARLRASDSIRYSEFGGAVALAGTQIIVGALDRAIGIGGEGAAYIFDLGDLHPSFCDASDGALASCPCANPGSDLTGCDLPQATGGVSLDVVTQEFVPQNRATLTGAGYPPTTSPAAILLRATGLDPSSPVVFGDGLRCVGLPVVRLGAAAAIGGTSLHTVGHGADAGAYGYQLWFRSTPAMFCDPAAAFNLSNGRWLNW